MFAAAEFTAGNWDVTEKIHAAYVQANFESGPLRGNVGARYVDTKSASAGFVCNPGALCNSEPDWTWQTTSKHYSNVLRSEAHTSELQSLMRISYAVFCL